LTIEGEKQPDLPISDRHRPRSGRVEGDKGAQTTRKPRIPRTELHSQERLGSRLRNRAVRVLRPSSSAEKPLDLARWGSHKVLAGAARVGPRRAADDVRGGTGGVALIDLAGVAAAHGAADRSVVRRLLQVKAAAPDARRAGRRWPIIAYRQPITRPEMEDLAA